MCTWGIGEKRLYKVTNITYCESIGIVLDQTDVVRSDVCRNKGVKGASIQNVWAIMQTWIVIGNTWNCQ